MIRTKGRVVLSKNPKEMLDAAKAIYEKHLELGADSPLRIIEDFDWTATGPKVATVTKNHTDAEFHKGEMEKNYANRDAQMPEIKAGLKKSINLLKATFSDNPKKLADWGIQVDDSPKAKATPKTPK
jgi:hypothetical protein